MAGSPAHPQAGTRNHPLTRLESLGWLGIRSSPLGRGDAFSDRDSYQRAGTITIGAEPSPRVFAFQWGEWNLS